MLANTPHAIPTIGLSRDTRKHTRKMHQSHIPTGIFDIKLLGRGFQLNSQNTLIIQFNRVALNQRKQIAADY